MQVKFFELNDLNSKAHTNYLQLYLHLPKAEINLSFVIDLSDDNIARVYFTMYFITHYKKIYLHSTIYKYYYQTQIKCKNKTANKVDMYDYGLTSQLKY